MKKSLIVLLVLVLVSSFAFAVDGEFAKSYSVDPKDSVELSGKVGAEYNYDFKTMEGAFDKSAKFAYFNLDATKVLTTGAGALKGEGAIYAAVDASLTFNLNLSSDFDADKHDGSGKDVFNNVSGKVSVYDYDADGEGWDVSEFLDLSESVKLKLAIENFYIAKDGAWKLDLLSSDASVDYAKSAISSKTVYNDDNENYTLETTDKVYANLKNVVSAHKGVTLTTEGNPYIAEVSFGMDGKTATKIGDFNLLVKSQEIALDNVTVSAGAVLGTKASTLNFDGGLKVAYADDVVAADAAADFNVVDLEDAKDFDADVAFNLSAAGVKFNFYYATQAWYKAPTDYAFYKYNKQGDVETLGNTDISVNDNRGKYVEAKLAYAFNYAGVDFEAGVKATDLNWNSRKFSFTLAASNDVFSFDGSIGYQPLDASGTEEANVDGDFEVTYAADLFDVAADFEFDHVLAETKADWGISLTVESDKIVDGANFGLTFTRATDYLSDILEGDASFVKAFVEVAF